MEQILPESELTLYDNVLLSDGKYAIIELIWVEALLEPETTYNFEVADYHTYYVGANNVLVHNKCVEPPNKIAGYTKRGLDQYVS